MDVKTTFLNGDLDEEINMEQPSGFVASSMEDKVCRLKKSLYAFKQAPKQWYEKFYKSILSFSFIVNGADPYVYSKMFGSDCVIISLYNNLGVRIFRCPAILEGYCNANLVTNNDEMISTSGYVFTLGGVVIWWKFAKQTCIARFMMESEFIALNLVG
ncbi:hypothetical protein PVK06_047221 [Gossypium arboreum]|uniref:Reverse transcriptase Ty1/copia-type domain-containing protein n=1 Tax=Gossypium arboreum TaxID=29729 RepID=A0ABR0MEM2_GOSAR|nr:hypothetical protein PVK06_047221 [Gossypium arboreum]